MPLLAYLPQDRRRALAGGALLPERGHGAVLFADLSGFTALTEALALGSGARRGVDELVRRINAVHEALIDEIERAGGSVTGLAGDGMTCWFDDAGGRAGEGARRALRSARGLQRAIRRFPDLAIRVGVSAGEALRLAVGDPAIQRIDLLAGATVARATVAQGLAEAGEVLVDDAVAQLLADESFGPPRPAPDGAPYRPHLFGPSASVSGDGRTAAPPPDSPDLDTLRPWILPFVFEREGTSGGLFATDLRPATALFVRLALGAQALPADAGTAMQALDAAVARVQRTLQQHGGVLLEVSVDAQGTCLYGNFGAAQVHEDDAGRALRAALQLRQQFGALGVDARIGLSSGTLCVGGYGGPTRRSFGAMGDEVNAAARLMGRAQAGEVLVSGRLRQLVADDGFAFEARAPIGLKGKAEPMPVFAALGLQQRRAIRLHEPPALLPVVGRDAETRRLAAAVAAARAGRGQFVRIVAEAGMGKSRLVAEAIRLARREGFIGFGGACRQEGIRVPYRVWHDLWSAFFDLDPALPQRRQHALLQAALQRHAAEHAEAWPLLGVVLGQAWPDTPFTAALEPKDRKALLETILRRCLQAAAAEAAEDGIGLLFVLEDLHAADPLSLDLLAACVGGIDALPVLVLVTERPAGDGAPADVPPAAALAGAQVFELAGLAASDVELVVRAKLALLFPQRSGALPPALLERVTARAQGNPFFVEALLEDLHDRGLDPFRPEALQALDLPSGLHSLVLSRMDRLPATQRNALMAASIIGREFTRADLQGYCPSLGGAEAVAADLDALARLGFAPLLPDADEPTHVFRHLVTLEVGYESIGEQTRARLHGEYARYLQSRHDDAPHLVPLLAHHFERAGCREEAVHYLRLAGAQAAARFANDEALSCFARALQGLPGDDLGARFALLVQRQPILDLLGRHDMRRQEIEALERCAAALPDAAARRSQVATLRARLEIEVGDYAAARAASEAALAALAALPPAHAEADALRVQALQQQVRVMLSTGEAAAARPALDALLALAHERGLAAVRAVALSNLGQVHWHAGEAAAAERCFTEALALARAGHDLRLQLNLLNSLGVVAKSRSRFTEAARGYEEALQIARRIGDRSGEAMLLNNLGSACLAAGRFHEAGRHSELAARMFEQAGESVLHAMALINRAESHREMGQYARAQALSGQALALMRRSGSRPGEALVLENLGLAEAALGRPERARDHLAAAAQLAREIGLPAREASALLHLGQLQTAHGDAAVAADALARAEALARTLGDEPLSLEIDAAQALRLLAQQAPPAQALARLQPVLARLLAPRPPGVPGAPMGLHAAALRVLDACGDARAAALRELSRRELHERAAEIPDASARRDYLEVADHRAVLGHPLT